MKLAYQMAPVHIDVAAFTDWLIGFVAVQIFIHMYIAFNYTFILVNEIFLHLTPLTYVSNQEKSMIAPFDGNNRENLNVLYEYATQG